MFQGPTPHCKDKIPNSQNKYSQKRNIGISVPISTFMRLWAIYIFPRSVCLFCWRKYEDRSWEGLYKSLTTHECWNWGWGRAIPRKGIHKWDFRYMVHLPQQHNRHKLIGFHKFVWWHNILKRISSPELLQVYWPWIDCTSRPFNKSGTASKIHWLLSPYFDF